MVYDRVYDVIGAHQTKNDSIEFVLT